MLTSLKDKDTLLLPFQYSCRRRRLPACRPHCLTAKQVAPNHESIRDVGLEEHARPEPVAWNSSARFPISKCIKLIPFGRERSGWGVCGNGSEFHLESVD